MQQSFLRWSIILAFIPSFNSIAATSVPPKEYLTAKEIEKIQDAQEIDKRIKIYLEAAALRVKTAEDRLNGKESEPGDPMEFFSLEDMLDGYFRIIRSVMLNLDGAVQTPGTDRGKLEKALKNLKDSTEKAAKDLAIIKKIAEEKKLEAVWELTGQALDVTTGAHEGSEQGLAQYAAPKGKPKR